MSRWIKRPFSRKQFNRNLLGPDVRFTPLSLVTTKLVDLGRPSSYYLSFNFSNGTVVGCSRRLRSESQRFRVDFSCLLMNHVMSCGEKVDLLPLAQGLKFTTRVRLIFSCAIERAGLFFFHDDALVNSSASNFIYYQQ